MITVSAQDFRDILPEGGRLLGLDVGTKTIGTALCDAGWSIASPAGRDVSSLSARQIYDRDAPGVVFVRAR